MSKEKVHVYIGRFQIPHIGHEATIKNALQKADRLVLLVGSSELARDPKNPFTFEERFKVLDAICDRIAKEEWANGRKVKYNIKPVHDYVYNNAKWLKEVQSRVLECTTSNDITITGCRKDKDQSTFYLNFFPQWKQDFISEQKVSEDVDVVIDHKDYTEHHTRTVLKTINSTDVRNEFFSKGTVSSNTICEETKEFLEKFILTKKEVYDTLVKEHQFVIDYRNDMNTKLPYNTIPFFTGDALVVCSGHVLLVKRRTFPGKGLWALPGGFFDKDQDLTQLDTAIRELQEETKIKVPEKVLRGSVVKVDEFGDFNRSLRWRIITRCVHIKLNDTELPKVKGSDDAEKAMWVPFSEIIANRDKFFEDHFSIIDSFLGLA